MLPFGAEGVAEMVERWGEGEEPAEISDTGLKINEWTKKKGLCDIYSVKMFQ